MKTVLTIAGSDCSGGAGIQADLKTMTMNGVYGMSVITALTAQNTTGVSGILNVSPEFVGQQIDAVFTDIRPDAVKIGMVSSGEIVHVIAEKLKKYDLGPLIVDPVMVAKGGAKLLSDDAISIVRDELISLASLVTPNIPEACELTGIIIKDKNDIKKAARELQKRGAKNVLIKGGHAESSDKADDYILFEDGNDMWLTVTNVNTLANRLFNICLPDHNRLFHGVTLSNFRSNTCRNCITSSMSIFSINTRRSQPHVVAIFK